MKKNGENKIFIFTGIGFERAFENRKRANPKSENAHMKKKKKRAKKKKKRAFEKPDARKKKRAFFFFFQTGRAFEKTTFSTRVRKTSPRKHEASTFSNARFFFSFFQRAFLFSFFPNARFFPVFQTRVFFRFF